MILIKWQKGGFFPKNNDKLQGAFESDNDDLKFDGKYNEKK